MKNEWISVEDRLPDNGVYKVRIVTSDLNVIESKRKLMGRTWFGGLRPFSEGETVTHWNSGPTEVK